MLSSFTTHAWPEWTICAFAGAEKENARLERLFYFFIPEISQLLLLHKIRSYTELPLLAEWGLRYLKHFIDVWHSKMHFSHCLKILNSAVKQKFLRLDLNELKTHMTIRHCDILHSCKIQKYFLGFFSPRYVDQFIHSSGFLVPLCCYMDE